MSFSLSTGAVPKCFSDTDDAGFQPTLQVIGFREVKKTQNQMQKRYRLIVSDGQHFAVGMLTTQLTHLIDTEQIKNNTVIKVTEKMLNNVAGRKLLIVLNCEVLGHSGEKIGEPIKFKADESEVKAPQAPKTPLQSNNASNYNGRPTVTSSPDIGCVPIMQINPYANRWKIKGRITNISPIRRWSNNRGDGKVFSISIMDKNGDDIRGSFFNEGVDRFHPEEGGPEALQKDSVYTFQGGRVKVANARWNDCKSEYEISFSERSAIVPCNENFEQRLSYSRTMIAKLENLQPDSRVDVIGVVQEVGPVTEFTSKKGTDLVKREITLADDSGCSVRCTLWGDLSRTPDEQFEGNPVVLLTRCKVGDYGGRSLSSSFGGATQLKVNPSFASETPHLQAWWSQGPGALKALTSGAGASGGSSRGSIERRKVLKDIVDEGLGMDAEKADFVNVKGYVTFVKHDKWCYPADPENKRRLTWDASAGKNGVWRNETSGQEYDKPMWSYCLQFQVQDYTGDRYVAALGNKEDRAEKLVGMSADELKRTVEHSDGSDPYQGEEGGDKEKVLDHLNKVLLWRQFNLCIMCKLDTRNDEQRVRANLHRVEPIDFATENKKLLDAIDEYDAF